MEIALFFLSIMLFLTYLSYKLLIHKENDEFEKLMGKEADRCLGRNCEIDENWNPPQGRVYRTGFAVVKKNGKKFSSNKGSFAALGFFGRERTAIRT